MKRILFVQHGDYRKAYISFMNGGQETYRDQKRSVNYVAALALNDKVTTVTFGDEEHCTELIPNLWSIGLRAETIRKADIARVLNETKPTHIIMRTPHIGFLREARRRKLWVLPCFADIFVRGGPRKTIRNHLLCRELLRSKAPCYSNHSLNASRSMIKVLGLPPDKVLPWDWSKIPVDSQYKSNLIDSVHPSAFFAGMLTEEKGVGDCLRAIAELKKVGRLLLMDFAGSGDLDFWREYSGSLGILDQVQFLGMISNEKVRKEMRRHDFILVPSRHSYAEGLPNTIYEALASRSVLVISDHPAFAGRLTPDEEVLSFSGGNYKSLSDCLSKGIKDTSLYKNISINSLEALQNLYIGMEWTELVDAFLLDPENCHGWVEKNCLGLS